MASELTTVHHCRAVTSLCLWTEWVSGDRGVQRQCQASLFPAGLTVQSELRVPANRFQFSTNVRAILESHQVHVGVGVWR